MGITRKRIGSLRVIEAEGHPDSGTIVIFHGFGANAADLAPLCREIATPGSPRWIFPEGILSLDGSGRTEGGSRAWWHIDQAAVERAMATGTHRDLTGPPPPGMQDALETILAFLKELDAPCDRLVLGGFSQGAMIASHLGLLVPEAPAGLLLFSGNAIDVETLERGAPERSGLPFFQSHGTLDPILSFAGARRLFDVFTGANLKGEFHEFSGGHEIPTGALQGAETLLNEVLG